MRNTPLKAFAGSALKEKKKKVKVPKHLINPNLKVKQVNPGSITKTAEDRMIEKHRQANPIYNVVKGAKNIYDTL